LLWWYPCVPYAVTQALGRNKGGAGAGARGGIAAPTKAGAAALGVSPSKLINRSKSAINPSRGKEVDPYQNIKEKGGAWQNLVCFLRWVVSRYATSALLGQLCKSSFRAAKFASFLCFPC
jgi:hypothetical protein